MCQNKLNSNKNQEICRLIWKKILGLGVTPWDKLLGFDDPNSNDTLTHEIILGL